MVDVDTTGDLAQVRQDMERRRIVFRVAANTKVGSGHLHRCLALADALQHHDVAFDLIADQWAWDMVEAAGYAFVPTSLVSEGADLLVVDRLDTDKPQGWDSQPTVHFEDHGPGARHADLVVNALYPAHLGGRERNGVDWAVLRPEFLAVPQRPVRETPVRVLVTFGGTDPAHLTERMLDLLGENGWDGPVGRNVETANARGLTWRFIWPPGRAEADQPPVSMVEELAAADLVICSAGRTVYEAAAVGCPAVVLAQNIRETTHSHLGLASGNVYLGLGRMVTDEQIRETLRRVLEDVELRRDLSERGRRLVDGKGTERVVWEIERLLRGL